MVTVPGNATGSLETGGDIDIFAIDLSQAGEVFVYTAGDTDTYGYLVDANDYLIAQDDDSGSGYNFAIRAQLDPGRYYVVVEGYDFQTIGGYTLTVGGDGGGQPGAPTPQIGVSAEGVQVSDGQTTPVGFGEALVGGRSTRSFTVSNSGDGVLQIDGVSLRGADAAQFRVTVAPASTVDPGRTTRFKVTYAPAAAGNHTAEVVIASAGGGEFAFPVAGVAGGNSGDDHADDIAGATALTLPGSLAAHLGEGDTDVFTFTVDSRSQVVARSTGDVDTYGILLDAAGEVVAENDDGGNGFNFRIRRRLDPGTYYLMVEGFDQFETGAYELDVR